MSISCVYLASPSEVAGEATNQFHKAAIRMGLKRYPWSNKHASYVSAINCTFVNEHELQMPSLHIPGCTLAHDEKDASRLIGDLLRNE